MKKIVALLTVVLILSAMFVNVSAVEPKNVLLSTAVEISNSGLYSTKNNFTAQMWDGNRYYNSSDATTYCDFYWLKSKTDAAEGNFPRYNIKGETDKADSLYFYTFTVELDGVYTVDTLNIYAQGYNNSASFDGFDVWLSETNDPDSFVRVISVTDLVCDQKYQKYSENGFDTAMYTESFAPVNAKYMIIGMTQVRCRHSDKLAAMSLTPNANPNYFRISEIELMGYTPSAAPETTKAPETTAAPETTVLPGTVIIPQPETTADTQAPETGDNAAFIMVAVVVALIGTAVVVKRKSHNA